MRNTWATGQTQRGGPADALLYADQKTYLVELLMKQDQMSMACSIESRVPFLDHPLVEFAAQVPSHLKIREGKGKYILRKAVERFAAGIRSDAQEDGLPDADQELAARCAGECAVRQAARAGWVHRFLFGHGAGEDDD